ncbi:MAG: hypothetical protein VB089_04765 [Anaerolineaceae bacterium]|nr:hypothetical protein [Anaerolineaceae bacterium]
MNILVALTEGLPVGTNLALLQFLWMLVSGALLPQRGAIFPALQATGLSDPATRRAWAAFRRGTWQMAVLLRLWQEQITGLPGWQGHRHEGYRAITVDVTAFWRPALQNCPSKHYHTAANRALPAVIFGVIGEVGQIGGQRLACPLAFERVHPKDPSESRLWRDLLRWVRRHLAADAVAVMDAGVKLADAQAAGLERYLLRLATNFTARRNTPLPYGGKGRKPVYGEKIRPLERSYKGKTIPASSPDRVETWIENGVELRAEIWEDLILPDVIPGSQAQTFRVYAIYDPAYTTPWLLATPLHLTAATVRAMYQDRWPVEQVPLSAKQMVGAHRQFVHADESIQRLPELALLAGSILSFLAATVPAAPTGFWDRQPKRTPGRFRRLLMSKPFPQSYQLPAQIRKKASVTGHLPKGILAHRRISMASAPVSVT